MYGIIPPSLGFAARLTVLDLHLNKLGGVIPFQLGSCSALAFFVLHKYIAIWGNPGLCGNLIGVACPPSAPQPIVLNPNSTSLVESPRRHF
uniref:Leucine-rich repeat-containing N-terminal plant-type domain-containing protein n=1 Tax=Physcomitrium patens TaxID=3218 RepID=A0A2K1KI52_PHYPA|nr:hypothetical protein PHYPA_007139 [Physcomitrium patens]